jgi:hypothetical protein
MTLSSDMVRQAFLKIMVRASGPRKKLFFLIVGLSLLMFSGASAVAFDFDLSCDHDSPGLISETPISIDDAITRIALIKFIKESFILSSAGTFFPFNRDPPYIASKTAF